MKSTAYSEKVLDHFRKPRNVGEMEGEDTAKGRVGNPVCGDVMEFYIKVKDNQIKDIKFQTFGCGSAVATASMITEMAKGKTLEEALKITRKDVADELDGLPPIKMHCSNLAADALRDAIKNYQNKQGLAQKPEAENEKLSKEIAGEREFLNKGVFHDASDVSLYKGKRTFIVDRGEKSITTAIELAKHISRVVFLTPGKDVSTSEELIKKLKQANVKILYESELLEIQGIRTVEKVVIHDLNEDTKYELFVDAVILI
jgi:nitrogen fixation NifU-like protein